MDEQTWLAERFEEHRSRLRAVAYRMLWGRSRRRMRRRMRRCRRRGLRQDVQAVYRHASTPLPHRPTTGVCQGFARAYRAFHLRGGPGLRLLPPRAPREALPQRARYHARRVSPRVLPLGQSLLIGLPQRHFGGSTYSLIRPPLGTFLQDSKFVRKDRKNVKDASLWAGDTTP
jgi:hypothetical protein